MISPLRFHLRDHALCPAAEGQARGGSGPGSASTRGELQRPHTSHGARQHGQAYQVIGRYGEAKMPVDECDAALPELAQQPDDLVSAEALLDWLPLRLTDRVALVLRQAGIERARVASDVLHYMGREPRGVERGHTRPRVVALANAHRAAPLAGWPLDRKGGKHLGRLLHLDRPTGHLHGRSDHQAVAVVHGHTHLIGELRPLAPALLREPLIGIGPRVADGARASLPAEVHRAIARIDILGSRRGGRLQRPDALPAGPCFQERAIDSEVLGREQPLGVGLVHDPGTERLGGLACYEPRTIPRERGRVPHLCSRADADEPAGEEIMAELLDESPLAPHSIPHVDHERVEKLLGQDSKPPTRGRPGRSSAAGARRGPIRRELPSRGAWLAWMRCRKSTQLRSISRPVFTVRISSDVEAEAYIQACIYHAMAPVSSASCAPMP